MRIEKSYLPFMGAMIAVIVASNYLVQFPVDARLGIVDLSEILTWGAFTYPVAFLVTDLTNRRFGPKAARTVVAIGFLFAILLSIWLATPRIAIASGTAFLLAQFLDVSIFDRMRRATWWKAPLISSLIGSLIDTVLFFGIAFAAPFTLFDTVFGLPDGSLPFPVPFLSVGADVPLWTSLAAGDFIVKMAVALLLLAPYRALRSLVSERPALAASNGPV
ncbi:queuosine precursor transporter [Pseudohoeflea coraliihabitans]|uniref:Probable queuosine precursor transporter n=1 Tax=Pseudohoeflea coraliihabitans TaxID=2860393 RepID=A0ABS6WKQ9_9HYPH|nr:queuosine precursor transporter [Pseudohoeflea sp. DP4N28-3]MBW3096534.1 queuosine precursor transporter [Pseudohoeflea sp. DP4N28-3]